jgi:hypothetical protein
VSAHEASVVDRDWWMGHVLIALFALLVAAILRVVPGWSAPLHAWIAIAAFVVGVLAVHAAGTSVASALRARWRAASLGLALAAGLGVAAGGLMLYGQRVGLSGNAVVFGDATGDAR